MRIGLTESGAADPPAKPPLLTAMATPTTTTSTTNATTTRLNATETTHKHTCSRGHKAIHSPVLEEESKALKTDAAKTNGMDFEPLVEVGMTPAEARAYLALLELGTSSAGPIITRSGLQSSVVHLVLGNLLAKGFVSTVKEGKKSHYTAIPPRQLIGFIDEKKARLAAALPGLESLRATAESEPQITSYRGTRGVKELLYELLDAGGKEHHTFGSASKSVMLGDEWWARYHAKRARKGIAAKLLFNESLKPWVNRNKSPKCEIRFAGNGFEPLTETIIRGDCVGIIVWLDKPVGVLMRHKDIAASYDKFFGVLWETAAKKK